MSEASLCACGCGEQPRRRQSTYCHGHWAKAHRVLIGDSKRNEGPRAHGDGYLTECVPMVGQRLQHILVAERALGKPLPKGAVVHHVNGDRSDNRPENLVICPDDAYHALLHRRMRAHAACGNYDWRRCYICKQWDAPTSLKIPKGAGGSVFHRDCLNAKRAATRAAQ